MAGKLGRALVLLVLLAAALITQAPLAVFLLAFALVLLVLLRLDAAYLRRQVTAELLVPDKPVIQGEDFTLTVRLCNRSRLPIPALVVLLNAADEWGGGQITLRCAAMLGGKESAEQRITLNAGKSGVWSIAVRGITLRDHLGVFTAACPAAVQSQSICVLPAAAAGKAKAETASDEDGDEADTRAALGGSYELREYRDGDTIKQVHWKLSAKLDRLMVREPLTALRAALTPGGELDGAEEWGDFPQQAAKHRKNPPKRKKERTALSRRGAADPGSGLKFVDRVLVSTQRPAAHPALWLAADAALLLALTFGLLLVLSTGFGIAVPLWVWPAAAAFCAGWALFLRAPQALRRWGLLAGVIVYLVVLFICQRNFLAGAQQCAGNIAQSLNARLGSALPVAQGGSAAQLGLFLLLAALPVTGALAAAALRRADALLLDLMLLPVVVLLALACAVVVHLFCFVLHSAAHGLPKLLPNPWVRAFLGGCVVVVFTLLYGSMRYNGAGVNIIAAAVEQGQALPWDWIVKILLTALTLSSGFKGGEVVPSFFVGATFGCVAAPLLGIPAGFGAALGLAGVFCGASNCVVASLVLAIELFGAQGLWYFAIVCGITYALSGYAGLYHSQLFLTDKLEPEYRIIRGHNHH